MHVGKSDSWRLAPHGSADTGGPIAGQQAGPIATPNPDCGTALVFMTHRIGPEVFGRLETLATQTRGRARTMVLIDAAKAGIEQAWRHFLAQAGLDDVQLVPFRAVPVARELGIALLSPFGIVPGCAHFPLMWLARKQNLAFYWLVEDDVVYSGSWMDFLNLFEHDRTDLLCSHVSGPRDIPHWPMWHTLKAPAAALAGTDGFSLATKCFLPIYRVSSRALDVILDYQRSGWAGHFECLVPTIAKAAGLSLDDLNRVAGVPVYAPGVIAEGEGAGPLSSLRFRPSILAGENAANGRPLIFHPVKRLPAAKASLLKRSTNRLLYLGFKARRCVLPASGKVTTVLPGAWLRAVRVRH